MTQLKNNEEEADWDNIPSESGHYPLLTRQGQAQYVPWTIMNMVGLAGRLPDLTAGAKKWILALEESTGGFMLAVGDVKALLMHLARKHITEEMFEAARLGHLGKGNMSDHLSFGFCRRKVLDELQKQSPEKVDASKLKGEELKKEECPAKFLRNFQRRWRE